MPSEKLDSAEGGAIEQGREREGDKERDKNSSKTKGGQAKGECACQTPSLEIFSERTGSSQRPLTRTLQILQTRAMHCGIILPILTQCHGTWAAERRLPVVRQGELQIWSQMRPCARFAGPAHVYGQEE